MKIHFNRTKPEISKIVYKSSYKMKMIYFIEGAKDKLINEMYYVKNKKLNF